MISASQLTIVPLTQPPDVDISVPGSKSHTNRALVCAALAYGRSILNGVLFADDTRAMMGAIEQVGATVEVDEAALAVKITGTAGALKPGPLTVHANQSGTTSRFMAPVLGLGHGSYVLDGHDQIRARPFGPLAQTLGVLGAEVKGDHLPLVINASGLTSSPVQISGSVSSQFLSGLLMVAPYITSKQIGLNCEGSSPSLVVEVIDELVSKPYIDLTLATMAAFGVTARNEDYRRFVVGQGRYRPVEMDVEPDASAASYFFAAAAITGGRVKISGLGRASLQGDVLFVDLLEKMGARVHKESDSIEVIGTGRLTGINVDMADISDTAQTLAVVATFADSPTSVTGIGFIRRKETDRLTAVVTELKRRGIRANEDSDGFTIYPGIPTPGPIQTYDDHRMAMSFALLGLTHPGITILNPECTAKTFPHYFTVLDQLR